MIKIKSLDDIPKDLKWKECRQRPLIIKAAQIHDDFRIETKHGDMIGFRGDYLLYGGHGELYPCQKAVFENFYTLLAKEDAWRSLDINKDNYGRT